MSPRKPQSFGVVGAKKPDLVIHTAERSASGRALARRFANESPPRIFFRIDGTPVFVVRIPNAGHYVHVTNEADVLREIDGFVRGLKF